MVQGLAFTSGALRAMSVLGVNFLGWTLMNHPLPWVELLVHGNTTYGSRWILQVQPTRRGPADFPRASAPEENSDDCVPARSRARIYLRRAARVIVLGVNFLG